MHEGRFRDGPAPDWRAFRDCILRKGTPARVHFIELLLDPEVQQAVCDLYGLLRGVDGDDPFFEQKRYLAVQRFLGYDYVRCGLDGLAIEFQLDKVADGAPLSRRGGRGFINEHRGPITTWEEFESFPWPDPERAGTRSLEWYSENLPENMCIIGSGGFAHFAEYLTWLMGYETLCYALYDDRDLVAAISGRLNQMYHVAVRRMLEFERVKLIWGSDDMGFKTGTLISPEDLRVFVLPGHKAMARISHKAGRPYLLHSCGNLAAIMDDLVDDVGIDGFHSFEDTIVRVADMKDSYGERIALLGGIDVDFLCRASEEEIRRRVRETLEKCMPGGGYCLGTGNSVANYIPLDNYLVMLDEGRRFRP